MTIFSVLTFAACVALTTFGSCNTASDSSSDSASGATASADNTGIAKTDMKSTLMEASRAYSFTVDGQPAYLTVSTTAEWPREIGDASLKALQDTLVAAAYPAFKTQAVKDAITSYLSDTTGVITGPAESINPASVPDTTTQAYTASAQILRDVITPKYVTYKVITSSYMGGAHPNTAVTPVSYDLTTGSVVTPAYLFKAGSEDAILAAVTNNLAMNLGVDTDKLRSGGLLVDKLPMPSGMYLDGYGTIVFQYGPYEIAPYSMGVISVDVTPFQLKDYLTPAAQALLGQ